MLGRTLADLVLKRDSGLVSLPWVGHTSPRWEPEPLRFLASRAIVGTLGSADRYEDRTDRPARRTRLVGPFTQARCAAPSVGSRVSSVDGLPMAALACRMKKREGDPWVSPPVYGRSLRGLGINLLVKDTARAVAFARDVLGLTIVYADPDLAVFRHGEHEWMVHADHTYDAHPLLPRTRIAALRGGGLELRVHGVDPDEASAAALKQATRSSSPRSTSPTGSARPTSSTPTATSGSEVRSHGEWSAAARSATTISLLLMGTDPQHVAYPGAEGSYTEEAATRLYPSAQQTAFATFDLVAAALVAGDVDRASFRSRTRSRASCPTRSRFSRRGRSRSSLRSRCTSRTLLGPQGATLETVRVVHSHPMALAPVDARKDRPDRRRQREFTRGLVADMIRSGVKPTLRWSISTPPRLRRPSGWWRR